MPTRTDITRTAARLGGWKSCYGSMETACGMDAWQAGDGAAMAMALGLAVVLSRATVPYVHVESRSTSMYLGTGTCT